MHPFHRLEDYLNAPEMPSVYTRLHGYKEKMFDHVIGLDDLMKRQGNLFEQLSRMFFGGEVKTSIHIHSEELKNPLLRTFDVIDKNGYLREVKSSGGGHGFKMYDYQFGACAYALAKGFDKKYIKTIGKTPRIFVDFYRYSSQKADKMAKKLPNRLLRNIRSLVSIEFLPLLLNIWDPETTQLTRYDKSDEPDYDGRKRIGPYTHFHSTSLTNLLKTPEDFILNLGYDPSNFIINKYKARPLKITKNLEISTFPILIIESSNPKEVLDSYIQKGGEKYLQLADVRRKKIDEKPEEGGMKLETEKGDTSFNPEDLQ